MVVNSMSYAKYESYKDSGEAWIGEIPSEWEVIKLKNIFYEKKHTRNMSLNCGSISFGQVICKDDDKVPEATKMAYQEVLNGEFLINPLNLNYDLISLRIALSKIDVVVSAGYIVLKNKIEINKEFFKYLLHRYDVAYMKLLGSGVRQTINFNHIANSLLVLPTDIEQTKIANFLDQKTTEIDQAIALKQQQIEKLNEYKQIVIQTAVTKGLNPNAPMKDSGVAWIGDIPEHWEVKKLKYLTSKIGSGITPSGGATTYVDKGTPLLRSQNIHFDGLVLDNVANISLNVHKSMKNSQVKQHDVLLNITGGSLGRCCYNSSNDEMNVNQHVCIVRPNNLIKGEFLNGLMSSEVGQKQIWFFQQGGGREGLNFQNLKNFDFPLPSIDEQKEIIAHIDSLKQHFKKSVDNYQTQIDRLKEYKNILINQAVTGKIKI